MLSTEYLDKPSDTSSANRLYAHATTYDELHTLLKQKKDEGVFKDDMGQTWKISVDGVNNRVTDRRMREVVQDFGYVGLDGKIALKNPEVELVALEDCAWGIGDADAR